MKTYELVCVIDAGLSSADILALKNKIEKLISIKEVDDIGLLPLAYPMNGQDQAYFLSYHIEMGATNLQEARTELRLMKGLGKFVFYAMKPGEKFMKFADLQKRYDALVEKEETKLNQGESEKDEVNVEG